MMVSSKPVDTKYTRSTSSQNVAFQAKSAEMAFSLARCAATPSLARGAQRTAVKPTAVKPVSSRVLQRTVGPAPSNRLVAANAVEIAQIAGEASFISGTAFTMCALTLVGLAVGFVLLRVEALVEEGKL